MAIAGCTTARIDTSGMSFSQEPLLGKVVWNDLITEDLDAARRFYGGLFGWKFEDSPLLGQKYVLARAGNVYVAGLVPVERRGDGSKLSRWVPYVSVDNVDSAVVRAKTGGAKVAVDPREVGIGRVAAIIDPEGAVIGLARSKIGDPDDNTTRPAAGHVVWTELLTDKAPSAAAAFYRSVAGYDVRAVDRRGGQYTMLTARGLDRAGILKNPAPEWKPVWLTYFGVDDPSAASALAEQLGGKILLPVSSQVREGTMAVVADPSGAVLVLQKLTQ
jgi:uncharacterized protein